MLEAVKQLEKLMEDFTAKYMDYDLSTWNYEELCKLEDRLHPFPLDKLKTKVYEARVARAEADNAKTHKDKTAKWKRYKYYKPQSVHEDPNEKSVNIYKQLEVEAYERVCVIVMYELMKGSSVDEINQKIKNLIPPITAKEIKEYLAKGKEGLQCFNKEAFDALFVDPPEGKVDLVQVFDKAKALGEANAFFKVCGLLGLDYDITAKEIGFYINP